MFVNTQSLFLNFCSISFLFAILYQSSFPSVRLISACGITGYRKSQIVIAQCAAFHTAVWRNAGNAAYATSICCNAEFMSSEPDSCHGPRQQLLQPTTIYTEPGTSVDIPRSWDCLTSSKSSDSARKPHRRR